MAYYKMIRYVEQRTGTIQGIEQTIPEFSREQVDITDFAENMEGLGDQLNSQNNIMGKKGCGKGQDRTWNVGGLLSKCSDPSFLTYISFF